jgi:hypothetical protein
VRQLLGKRPLGRLKWGLDQSQSYFTTDGLQPISSSWHQAPWDSRPDFFFVTEPLRSWSLCNILSDERVGLSLIKILAFVRSRYRIYSMLLKILPFALYKIPLCPGSAKQIMSVLRIFCCNGSLVIWTVVRLTTAQFKPLICSISGFAMSYTANMIVLMILYDFCLLPAQLCYSIYRICVYIYIYIYICSVCIRLYNRIHMEGWKPCAPWKISSYAENLALQALQF